VNAFSATMLKEYNRDAKYNRWLIPPTLRFLPARPQGGRGGNTQFLERESKGRRKKVRSFPR